MFTGDRKPDLVITLSDGDPDGWVDIGDALSIRIIGRRTTEIVFDRSPTSSTVVDTTSVLTMEWQVGDTDVPGRMQIEVEVAWPGGKLQTFRPSSTVDVVKDFDLSDTTP